MRCASAVAEEDFLFLFELFLNCDKRIEFWNPFSVVKRVSALATRRHLPLLEGIIATKEFWHYYRDGERPEPQIQVRDFDNVYFIKRLAGVALGKIAPRSKMRTVFKMLQHEYWVIRNAALEAISKHGNQNDLDPLLEIASAAPAQPQGLIQAICKIDEKINRIANSS